MTARSRWAPVAMLGVVAAMLAVHGLACGWAPIAADDWRHVLEHGGWWASHRSMALAVDHALVRVPGLHAIATPVATVALLVGTLTLAERRAPSPRRWSDVLGLAMMSAIVWLALPRAGVMLFHRSYAASQVWGCALAVWVAAPYRARWRLASPGWSIVMFVVAAVAVTATRQLAIALVVGLVVAVVRTPAGERRAWMWAGLLGAVAGVIADNMRAPWTEALRLFGRFEPSLVILAPALRAGGQVVALVGLIALAQQVVRALRTAPGSPALALPGDTLAWFAAWLGLALAQRVGPATGYALLLPAAVALAIAAWPVMRALATTPAVGGALIGLVVVVHAAAWPTALARYAALGDEQAARLAIVAATPPGAIAAVPPNDRILSDAWTLGDDWNDAALRESLARDRFGLRDIDLAPAFRGYEASPGLELALEVDGASDAQVRAAQPPASWPRSLGRARSEFAAVVARLRAAGATSAVARLRITNIDTAFPARRSRPIYAAWSDAATPLPVARRAKPDDKSETLVTVPPVVAAHYAALWLVEPDRAEPLACTGGRCRLPLARGGRMLIVACDDTRCGAADAWVAVF